MTVKPFKTFIVIKQLLAENNLEDLTPQIVEHIVFIRIPGTNCSYTQHRNMYPKLGKHAHVYAKQNGEGRQLYAVNQDGTGHDGSSGKKMPHRHAKHLRSIGYDIPRDNIIESLQSQLLPESSSSDEYTLLIFID